MFLLLRMFEKLIILLIFQSITSYCNGDTGSRPTYGADVLVGYNERFILKCPKKDTCDGVWTHRNNVTLQDKDLRNSPKLISKDSCDIMFEHVSKIFSGEWKCKPIEQSSSLPYRIQVQNDPVFTKEPASSLVSIQCILYIL